MKTFNRKQYINGGCTHQEYYAQFGVSLVDFVERSIGRERILSSTDKYFNDIHLREWDNLGGGVMAICGRAIAEANGSGGVSLSDCVCSAKAAARIIQEGAQ